MGNRALGELVTRDQALREPGAHDRNQRVPDPYDPDLRGPATRDAAQRDPGWPGPRSQDWGHAEPEQIEPEQRGSGPRGPGRRGPGRRRQPTPAGPSWRWGELSGGRATLIVLAAAVAGTGATIAMHRDPGSLLGGAVIAGTFTAALAVRREAVYQLIPVPALAYIVGALTAGLMLEQNAGPSRSGLAVSATQWVAGGFVIMTAATAVAAVITVIRWLMNRHAATGPPPEPEPLAANRLTRRPVPSPDPWTGSLSRPEPQPTSAPRREPAFRPRPQEPAPRPRRAPWREPPPPVEPFSPRSPSWPEPPARPGPPSFGAPRD